MIRTFITILFIILFHSRLLAQPPSDYFYDKYVAHAVDYSPVEFVTDPRYLIFHHLPDSIALRITKDTELQKVIAAGLGSRIYAVDVEIRDTMKLEKLFALLPGLKHLEYLKIQQLLMLNRDTVIRYQLPSSLSQLQQLQGIEFNATTTLNITDAFSKLAVLSQLHFLSFGLYNSTLPSNLSTLTHLHTVNLSASTLRNIDFSQLHWQKIYLNGSAPNKGPDQRVLNGLASMPSVQHLQLAYSVSPDLTSLQKLPALRSLALQFIYTAASDNLFGQVAQLTHLSALTVNILNDTSQNLKPLSQLRQLKSLALTNIGVIKKHPEQLSILEQLPDLTYLDLKTNDLPTVPPSINRLKALQTLVLEGNSLTSLPAALFTLPHLMRFSASANKLQGLPEFNVKGSQLTYLDLEYNAIQTIPSGFTQLNRLKELNLSYNKIQQLPPSGWVHLAKLQKAEFTSNLLHDFPNGLQQVSSLQLLNISSNQISTIPEFNGNNYQLIKLWANDNKLTHLPESIGQLIQLEELSVWGNKLSSLPESLGQCTKLVLLDAHTDQRTSIHFNAETTGSHRYAQPPADSSKINHIGILPIGLKNAVHLETLNLSGNTNLDVNSIFDVLLATPRAYVNIDLSSTGIRYLPATPNWANLDVTWIQFDNNQLTTLPTEFALIKNPVHISINRNPLNHVEPMYDRQIASAAYLKVLFEELNVPFPRTDVSAVAYCTALTHRANELGSAEKCTLALKYANQALATDSATYAQTARFDYIGACRFKEKDYTGAIRDFDLYITQAIKQQIRIVNYLSIIEPYKVEAHLALHQPEQAAQTHILFAREFGIQSGFQEAAIIYLKTGKHEKAAQWLDTALAHYKYTYAFYQKRKQKDIGFILDYAETLIVSGKYTDAIQLIDTFDEKSYYGKYQSIKNYLLATATYLNKPADYNQIKSSLIKDVATAGSVSDWNFTMFNDWVANSGKPTLQQKQLLELETIVK